MRRLNKQKINRFLKSVERRLDFLCANSRHRKPGDKGIYDTPLERGEYVLETPYGLMTLKLDFPHPRIAESLASIFCCFRGSKHLFPLGANQWSGKYNFHYGASVINDKFFDPDELAETFMETINSILCGRIPKAA